MYLAPDIGLGESTWSGKSWLLFPLGTQNFYLPSSSKRLFNFTQVTILSMNFFSQTRASWNNDLFSPYSYLYEMPKNYHTCNSSVRMNSTDLRGDVFLSFRVMSIKGSTMTNNANICEKYCCQEPRCQAWTLRFQQADTANCPKGQWYSFSLFPRYVVLPVTPPTHIVV